MRQLNVIVPRDGVEIYVAPATVHAWYVRSALTAKIQLAAQNCSLWPCGARTGEVSASMLRDVGISLVILGHSERRSLLGETSDQVAQKVDIAIRAGLRVTLCIGETECTEVVGEAWATCERQLRAIQRSVSLVDDWSI